MDPNRPVANHDDVTRPDPMWSDCPVVEKSDHIPPSSQSGALRGEKGLLKGYVMKSSDVKNILFLLVLPVTF